MKIAVCISGQIRTLDQAAPFILDFVKHYNADVFCHAWTTNKRDGSKQFSKEYVEDCIKFLGPKNFQVDDFNPELLLNYPLKESYKTRHVGQFAGIYKANELKKQYEQENNFTYDIVVRYRYDHIFKHYPIDLSSFNKDYIYMPAESSDSNIADLFYFGSSSLMDKTTETYMYLEEYFKDGISVYTENPEKVFAHHISKNSIPLKRFNCSYHTFLRCEYDGYETKIPSDQIFLKEFTGKEDVQNFFIEYEKMFAEYKVDFYYNICTLPFFLKNEAYEFYKNLPGYLKQSKHCMTSWLQLKQSFLNRYQN